MLQKQEVILQIKNKVREIIPDAEVSLFGSRAINNETNESDWDVLITSKKPVNKETKRFIQKALFPLSVTLAAFINTVIVNEDDWNNNPSYYSLRQSILSQSLRA